MYNCVYTQNCWKIFKIVLLVQKYIGKDLGSGVRRFTFHFVLLAYFCHILYITFSIKNIRNCRKNVCGFYALQLGFTYPTSFRHHNSHPIRYIYFYFTGKETKIHHTLYEINRTKSLTYIAYIIGNILHLNCLMSDTSIFFSFFELSLDYPRRKETQDQSILLYPCEFLESAICMTV